MPIKIDKLTGTKIEKYKRGVKEEILQIPEGVRTIEARAFEGTGSAIKKLTIASTVDEIGEYAFKSCSSLEEIEIPNGVTILRTGTFEVCRKLRRVTLPETLTQIDSGVFAQSGIESIHIPAKLTNIDISSFDGCKNLKKITVDKNNPYFKSHNGLLLNKSGTTLILCPPGVKETVIPESVRVIGVNAFMNSSTIEKAVLPKHLERIDKFAFNRCFSLKSINFPDTLAEIEANAFEYCSSLVINEIPPTVRIVGSYAFEGCSSITQLTITNKNVELGARVFRNCDRLASLTIPYGLKINSSERFFVSCFENCRRISRLQIIMGDEQIVAFDLTGFNTNLYPFVTVSLLAGEYRNISISNVDLYPVFWHSYVKYNYPPAAEFIKSDAGVRFSRFLVSKGYSSEIDILFENKLLKAEHLDSTLAHDIKKCSGKYYEHVVRRSENETLLKMLQKTSLSLIKAIIELDNMLMLNETISRGLVTVKNVDKLIAYASEQDNHEAYIKLVDVKNDLGGYDSTANQFIL